MRIERISSLKDLGLWVIDQIGHVAIVCVATFPVLALGDIGVPIAGALVLSIREWEDWRSKTSVKRFQEAQLPFVVRHADKTIDVIAGSVGAWLILGLI